MEFYCKEFYSEAFVYDELWLIFMKKEWCLFFFLLTLQLENQKQNEYEKKVFFIVSIGVCRFPSYGARC